MGGRYQAEVKVRDGREGRFFWVAHVDHPDRFIAHYQRKGLDLMYVNFYTKVPGNSPKQKRGPLKLSWAKRRGWTYY